MSSPRTIHRELNYGYINEILELCENISLYSNSLLVDYSYVFNEDEKNNISKYNDKIEEYMNLLNGFKQLLIKKCDSSIHIKFKVIVQEIFEIEQLLKQYSIKVWKDELTDINNFKNGSNYCFTVYSLLMNPKLRHEQDKELIQQKYEERLAMLQDKRRRYLSTSLVANELTCLFYESHIAAIINVDESNYIGACSQDAGTGDSMFTTNLASHGNYDDIYTLRRDELGNIYTKQPATIVSTPKVIKNKQLYDDRTVTISEIILDRMKSETQGILCYVYGNKFLSYSKKFAERLGLKYNLPVIYIDKMLYTDKKICEYEIYERYEIIDGIQQYIDDEIQKEIYYLSGRDFKKNQEIYLNIFRVANEKIINSNEEAKEIIEEIVQQLIRQKIIETER